MVVKGDRGYDVDSGGDGTCFQEMLACPSALCLIDLVRTEQTARPSAHPFLRQLPTPAAPSTLGLRSVAKKLSSSPRSSIAEDINRRR